MARQERKLTAASVAALVRKGVDGKHSDGGGLVLDVRDGRQRWTYSYTFKGRGRAMGLGGYPAVPLQEAREARDKWRRVLREGRDPIEARQEADRPVAKTPTFAEVAEDFVKSKEAGWRSAKNAQQFRRTLKDHAGKLLDKPVDEVTFEDIHAVLIPIWTRLPATASRVRSRIERVLGAAKARGLRKGENPAAWRDGLSHVLPQAKRQPPHHAAMDYRALPAFMATLRTEQEYTLLAFALEFLILTASRAAETLGARWAEVDLERGVWTIPPLRMKAGREHRVPLSDQAADLLRRLAEMRTGDLVFPGGRRNKPFNRASLLRMLGRLYAGHATIHGFRSAFRDWAGEETDVPREVAEQALAHAAGDGTELAYRRGDALEKRRRLMQAWADYVRSVDRGNVVALRA